MAILCQEVRELHSLYIYIHIFCAVVSLKVFFFAHSLKEYNFFKTDLFDPIDETLTDTTTLGQLGHGSNDSEGLIRFPRSPELESHHQMQFSFKPKIPPFWRILNPPQWMCQHTLISPTEYDKLLICYALCVWGGACGVMVIVIENGHGDTSSNPGRDWLHFS